MKPDDLLDMHASKNKDEVVAFMNTALAGGMMDQLQTPYYYDFVLHSVSPVAECIANANLKPIPGALEYVPGCQDCFYRKHQIYSATDKKMVEAWCRYNLSMSEDIRQLMVGRTLHTQICKDDCENFTLKTIGDVNSLIQLKKDLQAASDSNSHATLDEFINPKFFGLLPVQVCARTMTKVSFTLHVS